MSDLCDSLNSSIHANSSLFSLPSSSLARTFKYFPARASEQGNVIGLVSVYVCVYKFFL